jgi:hypothetical protein
MTHRRSRFLRICGLAFLAGTLPAAVRAQATRFLTVGAGTSFPVGGASQGMNAGWLAEAMGGITLSGNVVTLRLGGSYGQNSMDASSGGGGGGGMMGAGGGGIERTVGAMAGVMVMPDLDRDLIPYVLASTGLMNSSFGGGATSFAWAAGVGATLQTGVAAFYVECRFVRARSGGGPGDMIPLTAGIRIGSE